MRRNSLLIVLVFLTLGCSQKYPVEPKFAIEPKYGYAELFYKGRALAGENCEFDENCTPCYWSFIDRFGVNVVRLPCDYNYPSYACDFPVALGAASAENPEIAEYVREYNERVWAHYKYKESIKEDPFPHAFGDKVGYVDRDNSIVIAPVFEKADVFSEGLAAVRVKGGLWGYIDKEGNMIIVPCFVEADEFNEGLAVVRVKGDRLFGYIENPLK